MPDPPKDSIAHHLLAAARQPPPSTSETAQHISDRSRLSIQHLSGEPLTQAPNPTVSSPPSLAKLLIDSATRPLPTPNISTTTPPSSTTMHRSDTPPSMAHDIAYTRTGRISKAKKGLKVHHCKCGRSYTRAEHLRRHQKNHEEEPLRCDYPECGKAFHRPDLLQRHKERHSEMRREGSMDSRLPSSTSIHGSSMHSEYPVDSRILHNSMYPASTAPGLMDLNAGLLGMPMSMATSAYDYPVVTTSAPNDTLPNHFMYQMPMKSHEERDEDERKTLFPQVEFDIMTDLYQSGDYIDCYWRHFHPVYPVVHRATFAQEEPSPMLRAAMMAVGAQYSKQANARADSRNFHERCLRLMSQRDLDVGLPQRSCDMQAIFLIELVSQYKGRRASQHLSTRFRQMYHTLANDTEVMSSGNTLDTYANLSPSIDEHTKYEHWKSWTRLSTRQRLLIACYILESQQDSLLARKLPQLTISGLELPLPSRLSVWDANSASAWLFSMQQYPHSPTFVYAISTDLNTPQSFQAADAFQSALLISAHLNRFKSSSADDIAALPAIIDTSIPTQVLYLACHLSRDIPLRDLLAVSGESWILSEKVAAKETFTAHKTAVRNWIAPLWTYPEHALSIHTAIKHSVRLLRLSLSTQPSPTLIPGTEMGLYTAVLVLWAVTTAATSRWKQCVRAATPTPQMLPSTEAGAEMDGRDLERETAEFINLFDFDTAVKGIEGVSRWPQGGTPLALTQWQRGVGAVLRRVQSRIGGREVGSPGGSPGELLDGAVGVLGKLGRNGWGLELF